MVPLRINLGSSRSKGNLERTEQHSEHRCRRSVHNKEQVKEWIIKQGKETSRDYYFEGLSYRTTNLDTDDDLEVVAGIEGSVHLGQFFIFDKHPEGKYLLIKEENEKVEQWKLENPIELDGKKLFEFISRTGGTGVDTYETHLWYLDQGKYVEAWKGKLQDRSIFQGIYSLVVGGFRVNPETKRLYTWESFSEYQEDGDKMPEPVKTVTTLYRFDGTRFVKEK